MIIPNTIVDNFFYYPDKIRDFGLSLSFNKPTNNIYAGTRTDCLSYINRNLYNNINRKVTSLFFDFKDQPVSYQANVYFQKVSSIYEEGWIHQDPNDITFIVYLNPKPNLKEGTSIYQLNDIDYDTKTYQSQKEESFNNTDLIPHYRNLRKEHNSHYTEILNVPNVYNRLFAFDGFSHHGANEFKEEGHNTRLILIGFISNITRNDTAIRRIQSIGI